MKKHVLNFLHRGLTACWVGPVVLAIIYLTLQSASSVEMLTINQVCIGIFSMTLLAFLAGGMNFIYQIEKLPLMVAVLVHGCALYIGYLITYLVNNWLEISAVPLIVFSVIFAVGFITIWAIIYIIAKKRTEKLNAMLNRNRQNVTDE